MIGTSEGDTTSNQQTDRSKRLQLSKVVGIRLDAELVDAVDREALSKHSTRSAVMRELILPLLQVA